MKRIALLLPLALLLVLSTAPVTQAATRTTIDVTVTESGETFTTTGGALCPSGTAETFNDFVAGGPRNTIPHRLTFHVDKLLTCDDGSGTFTIGVEAKLILGAPNDTGAWRVTDGTGDYAGLRGGGSLIGVYFEGEIVDYYTGMVNF